MSFQIFLERWRVEEGCRKRVLDLSCLIRFQECIAAIRFQECIDAIIFQECIDTELNAHLTCFDVYRSEINFVAILFVFVADEIKSAS